MKEFLDGESSFDVIRYDNDSPEARADTADLAIMAIEEPSWKRGYNLLAHNCEHFAKFCRTGQKQSRQSDAGVSIGSSIGGALLLGSVASIAVAMGGGEDYDSD